MKEFLKWLGVNEKIAKIAVWMLIFMVFLIIINMFLESIELPYYKITTENLSKINYSNCSKFIFDCIVNILNFYTIVFLVFKVKDSKKILKYAVTYLVLCTLVTNLFGYLSLQIFIIIYILTFCYIYSKNNWKYILYGIIAFLVNTGVQCICYLYKARFVNFNEIGQFNRFITSIDYFIVLFLIIIVKEIYIRKREVKK